MSFAYSRYCQARVFSMDGSTAGTGVLASGVRRDQLE